MGKRSTQALCAAKTATALAAIGSSTGCPAFTFSIPSRLQVTSNACSQKRLIRVMSSGSIRHAGAPACSGHTRPILISSSGQTCPSVIASCTHLCSPPSAVAVRRPKMAETLQLSNTSAATATRSATTADRVTSPKPRRSQPKRNPQSPLQTTPRLATQGHGRVALVAMPTTPRCHFPALFARWAPRTKLRFRPRFLLPGARCSPLVRSGRRRCQPLWERRIRTRHPPRQRPRAVRRKTPSVVACPLFCVTHSLSSRGRHPLSLSTPRPCTSRTRRRPSPHRPMQQLRPCPTRQLVVPLGPPGS
eukprot:Rmarinus@m.12539